MSVFRRYRHCPSPISPANRRRPYRRQPTVRFSYDGEWAWVGSLAVYPREDATFSIGRIAGAATYCDIETGFANQQAAIDHALWLVGEG